MSAADQLRDLLIELLYLVGKTDTRLADLERQPVRTPWPRKAPDPLVLAAYRERGLSRGPPSAGGCGSGSSLTILLGHGWEQELLVAWGSPNPGRSAGRRRTTSDVKLRAVESRVRLIAVSTGLFCER
jgi:hypothetical protein